MTSQLAWPVIGPSMSRGLGLLSPSPAGVPGVGLVGPAQGVGVGEPRGSAPGVGFRGVGLPKYNLK
jgi:hypothetical protein